MQCPICGSPARDRTPPGYNGVIVSCSSCGNFQVAGAFLDRLRALEPDVRREILVKAKEHARFGSPSIDRHVFDDVRLAGRS